MPGWSAGGRHHRVRPGCLRRHSTFSDFDSVEFSDAFEAEITACDGYVVEVTVDDNLVDHLQVEQHGDTVKIGLKPFTAVANAHMLARIYTADLSRS